MIKIRKNTFETNSSSAHTVVLTNSESYVSDEEIEAFISSENNDCIVRNSPFDEGFYLKIKQDSFGREFRILGSWEEKLPYVYASLNRISEFNILRNVLARKFGDNFLGLCLETSDGDHESEEKLCPAIDMDNIIANHGDIDHQSVGVLDNAMKLINNNLEDALFETIFSNKVVIIVDGDETYAFDDLLRGGVLGTGGLAFEKILHTEYPRKKNGNHDWDHPIHTFIDIDKYLKRHNDDE